LWSRVPKSRWFWIFIGFGLGAGSSIWFRKALFLWLYVPSRGLLSPFDGLPVFDAPTGALNATIFLGLKSGVVTAIPVAWVALMTKIKPRVPDKWWWFAVTITLSGVGLAIAGGAFVYIALMPAGLGWLLNHGAGYTVPVIKLGEYTGLLGSMMMYMMIIFQLPLLMYALAKVGIMPYFRWRMIRKIYWSTAMILGAFLSPGVELTIAMTLFLSMVALYEVGLFIAWMTNNNGEDYFFARHIGEAVVWTVRRPIVMYRRVMTYLRKHGIG